METEGPFQTPWTQQAKAAKLLQRAAPKSKMQTGDELDVSMSNFLVLLQRINQRRERIWPDSMCRTELLQCFSNIKDGLKIPSFWQGAGLNTNAFSNRTHLLGILSAFQVQKKHQHHPCLADTAYRQWYICYTVLLINTSLFGHNPFLHLWQFNYCMILIPL